MVFTLIFCAALIAADQLIKALAIRYLMPVETATLIPGLVELRYIENRGAAFGILSGQQTLLIIVTGAVLAVGLYILQFRRPKDRLEYVAIMLIFSGGVGNLIDRAVRRYVVDYINLLFMDFAVFNLADCLVCIGFVLLIIAVFRIEKRAKWALEAQEAEAPEAAGAGAVIEAGNAAVGSEDELAD